MKILILLASIIAISGCTYARMITPEGIRVTYVDFHPAGNAVDTEAIWEGVGRLKVNRQTEDSSAAISAAAEGITSALVP